MKLKKRYQTNNYFLQHMYTSYYPRSSVRTCQRACVPFIVAYFNHQLVEKRGKSRRYRLKT